MGDIGVVTAMHDEARTWLHIRPERNRIHTLGAWQISCHGIGFQHAEQAAHALLANGVEALLVWGVAGGLLPSYQPGDLVMPDRIVSNDGCHETDAAWRESMTGRLRAAGMPVHGGGLWCQNELLMQAEAKQALGRRHDCGIVDMESAAVARVATQADIPCAVVRVVTDPATVTLPADLPDVLTDTGRLRVSALAALLLRRPGIIGALHETGRHYKLACKTLRQAADILQHS